MQMDWIMGLLGGLLIGGAAALYLLANGRIMGASGILGGVVDGSAKGPARTERLAFIAGLVGVPLLIVLWRGAPVPPEALTPHVWVLVLAGLLVGLGTRLANGCTSGHGVCGISRFSVRGVAATVCYLLAGAVGVVLFRHILGVV